MGQKLSIKTRKRLGNLINDLMVDRIMQQAGRDEADYAKVKRWIDSEEENTITLFDEFGIELPTYSSLKEVGK